METIIYLVRHGETEWNRQKKLQGHLNSNLTKEGIKAAEQFKSVITGLNPDTIYSSDQPRALITARILTADLNKEIIVHPGLREMNFGVFQGHDWNYIEENMKNIYDSYRVKGPEYIIPKGESHKIFYKRTSRALEEITKKNIGRKIMIVSHGGTINKMLTYVKKLPVSVNRYFSTKNLALITLNYRKGHFTLITPVEIIDFKK